MSFRLIALTMSSTALMASAYAQDTGGAQEVPAELVAHAVLPAQSFVPPPADAPEALVISGRFAASRDGRVDQPGSVAGRVGREDRPTGVFFPFTGQPVQGFSGIETLSRDRFRVLTDNGFGSQGNSPDAMLMMHEVRVDWDAGQVIRESTTFLKDRERVVPFKLELEHTEERYLTGSDFDVESIQTIGDRVWIGDEFGPYLIAVDEEGVVQAFFETRVGGEVVTSPDNHTVGMPATPEEVGFEVRRSRGFEGMAAALDEAMLYPLLEAPLLTGGEGSDGGQPSAPLLEFDPETREWTGNQWSYPLEDAEHAIGDFNMIDERHGLVIERDWKQGDPRMACEGEAGPTCFADPAQFKRIYRIEIPFDEPGGEVVKESYIDLMDIADPDGNALVGTQDGRFTFPFVTIEDVDAIDQQHIVVANDNNLPFSAGRRPQQADDNEFILLSVPELLSTD